MAQPTRTEALLRIAANLSLMLRAWFALARVSLALRRVGFQTVVTRISEQHGPTTARVASSDIRRAQRLSRNICRAARLQPLRAACLERSLILHDWLLREGYPSELRIGVLKEEHTLKAHAWVELAGVVVSEPPAAVREFTPLAHGAAAGDTRPTWRRTRDPQWP